MTNTSESNIAPIWFIAHGGPPMIENVNHPAHQHWLKIAQQIKENHNKIKGIVFISAHWQAEEELLSRKQNGAILAVGVNETMPNLIYDFFNFPPHFYKLQFKAKNPQSLGIKVQNVLKSQGLSVAQTPRGLDHGVYVPLIAMFGQEAKDFPPMIQISLPPPSLSQDSVKQDGIRAMQLGKALSELRNQGIAIMGGGQPVHNLNDFRKLRMQGVEIMTSTRQSPLSGGYGFEFLESLCTAMTAPGQGYDTITNEPKRWNAVKDLFLLPTYKKAHPTSEHLLPLLVCFGAAKEQEVATRDFQLDQGPLGWDMYSWGT